MASSRQYLNQIRGRYPKIDPEDLIAMMNALAIVWAEARCAESIQVKATKRDYRFAATVFCVLHHRQQPPSLPGEIRHLAQTYRGISKDRKRHAEFRQSISIGLLAMCKDSSAVLLELSKHGISGLFRL